MDNVVKFLKISQQLIQANVLKSYSSLFCFPDVHVRRHLDVILVRKCHFSARMYDLKKQDAFCCRTSIYITSYYHQTCRRNESVLLFAVVSVQIEPPHEKKKTTICIGENKCTDQLRSNCKADQHLCFRYTDRTIPLLSNSKISSL